MLKSAHLTSPLTYKMQPTHLERLPKTELLPIAVWEGDIRRSTLYVKIRVEVWQEVYVATEKIPKGSELTTTLFRKERRKGKDLPPHPILLDSALKGAVTVRPIGAGTILTKEMVTLPIVVLKNSLVKVRVVNGTITILGEGISLKDGRVGEIIEIENPLSKKKFHALVVGPGEVRLELQQ